MPLIPYERLVLDSPLSADEVLARLAAATEDRGWVRLGSHDHRFHGWIDDDGAIRIERAIGHGNSVIPRIHGRLLPLSSGSRLEATLKMRPAITAFMAVWLAGLALIGMPATLITVIRDDLAFHLILTPVLIFVVGWAVMMGMFTLVSWWTKAMLSEILGADLPYPEQRRVA